MAPPTTKFGRLQKFWFWFTILYLLWKLQKIFKNIRFLSNDIHCCLQNRNAIQSPSKETFPQYFQNRNGLWIHVQYWMLSHFEEPKGVVIITHGLAEHIQRYEHLARALHLHGFICYGIDHQGHGLSDGDRCYVNKFSDYVDELLIACRRIKEEYTHLPIFLFGHSAGGLIASYAALKEPELFNGGIIFSSPFFGIYMKADGGTDVVSILNAFEKSTIVEKLLKYLSTNLPKLKLFSIDNKLLSHDQKIQYHIANDELHFKEVVPVRTGFVIVEAAKLMVEEMCENVEYSFFIFGGENDFLCNGSNWKIFFDKCKSKDKEFAIFEGLYHECLNETQPQQQKVMKNVVDWLLRRVEIVNQV